MLAACEEVKKSGKFKKVLEVVLALGNYLNGGSFRGGAYGFKLDALTKLRYFVISPSGSKHAPYLTDARRDTKSAEGDSTLLHYLVDLVGNKYPEALNWGRELKHVPPAARVSLSTVQSNVAQLVQGFKQIEREIPLSSEDPSDPFRSSMTEFFEKKKEECDQLEADTKTMEVTHPISIFLT